MQVTSSDFNAYLQNNLNKVEKNLSLEQLL